MMGSEQIKPPEARLGIRVPFGRNILISTFPLMLPEPDRPLIDLAAKKTAAAWLTTPLPGLGQGVESVIGPNGEESAILLQWTEEGPEFFTYTAGALRKNPIKVTRNPEAQFLHVPEGGVATLVGKPYPGLVEHYTVLQLPGPEEISPSWNSLAPYFEENRLVSGMRNRGFVPRQTTGLLAIRITDKSDLPFGRELSPTRR